MKKANLKSIDLKYTIMHDWICTVMILNLMILTLMILSLINPSFACESYAQYKLLNLPQTYWQTTNGQAINKDEARSEIILQGRLIKNDDHSDHPNAFKPKYLMSVDEVKSTSIIVYLKAIDRYFWVNTDEEGIYHWVLPQAVSESLNQLSNNQLSNNQLSNNQLSNNQLSKSLASFEFQFYATDLEDQMPAHGAFIEKEKIDRLTLCLIDRQTIRFRPVINMQNQAMIAIRSDIDLTYLETDFHSKSALLDLLSTESKDRIHVKGMDQMMRYLQRLNRFSLVFLSGSPTFFQKHLLERFRLDGVDLDGLYLKDFKKILKQKIWQFEWFSLISALKAQIFYKLNLLFSLRRQLPSTTQEILLGDDSEADHVVYDLYQKTVSRQMNLEALTQDLIAYELSDQEIKTIIENAGLALKQIHIDLKEPVLAMYIHLTDRPNQKYLTANLNQTKIRFHHQTKEIIQDLIRLNLFSLENLKTDCQKNHCIDLGIDEKR